MPAKSWAGVVWCEGDDIRQKIGSAGIWVQCCHVGETSLWLQHGNHVCLGGSFTFFDQDIHILSGSETIEEQSKNPTLYVISNHLTV